MTSAPVQGGPARLFVVLLALGMSCGVSGQEAAVPVAREPHHHVVFSNTAVRVIDARLPPGSATLYHTHDADNVPVVIRGGPMTIQVRGGVPEPSIPRTGDASFAAGGYTHRIVNTGPGLLHFVDVELHAAPPHAGAPAVPLPPDHDMVLETARVRVLRHRVGAGPSTDRHARALLAVVVPPGHDVAAAGPAGAPAPGAYRWRAARQAARRLPAGTEVVEIEIKP